MAETVGHDSRAVANKILEFAKDRGIELTIMQLLKLIYFANGWYLARFGTPLTRDHAEAWKHGPVYPAVYRSAGLTGVKVTGPARLLHSDVPVEEDFTPEEAETIAEVVDGYGEMHAFQLSRLTHEEGSPWYRTYHEKGPYSAIPNKWVRQHFEAKEPA